MKTITYKCDLCGKGINEKDLFELRIGSSVARDLVIRKDNTRTVHADICPECRDQLIAKITPH